MYIAVCRFNNGTTLTFKRSWLRIAIKDAHEEIRKRHDKGNEMPSSWNILSESGRDVASGKYRDGKWINHNSSF